MEKRTVLRTDLSAMNISQSDGDLDTLELRFDFITSLVFTVFRLFTLIFGIIVHRAFYKLMKRLPGRSINQIIYPNMVMYQFVAEILPEMIELGPMYITDLFQNNSIAYFNTSQ